MRLLKQFSSAVPVALPLSIALLGCSRAEDPEGTSEAPDVKRAIPGADSDFVRVAIDDLATRLDLSPDDIEVTRFDEVTWPDGSMGCPRKGMKYTQVLVNGSLIVLRADGTDYHYHSGGTRPPFYCPNPSPPVQGEGGNVEI